MDFLDDPRFRQLTTDINNYNGSESIREIMSDADSIWLDKCGHTFLRHAISSTFNRHYFTEGSSFIGGRVTMSQIKNGEIGRLFVNMTYVLLAVKTENDFIFVSTSTFDNPSFDIYVEY